mgnify:CR=1 FL=1
MILKTADLNTPRGHVVADLSYTDQGGLFVTALDGAYARGTRIAVSPRGSEQDLIEALIAKGVDATEAAEFVAE